MKNKAYCIVQSEWNGENTHLTNLLSPTPSAKGFRITVILRCHKVIKPNGSKYSRMDLVKHANTAFKKFEVIWS